ncbi:MAG: SdrD B-like domain-containing protein [Chloroflexota bacterium]
MRSQHGNKNYHNKVGRIGFRILGIIGILLSVSTFLAMSFSVMSEPNAALAAACGSTGDISGTVFYDYDNDGIQDANEPGIEGVTVSGYISSSSGTDSAGTPCETGSDGSYTFNQSQFPVRIEFSLPAELEAYLKPSAAGGTTVQFVNAASSTVDVGYHDPADYCQANFEFSTTCFVYGLPTDESLTPQDAVVTLDYNEPGMTQVATGYGDDFRFTPAPHDIEATSARVGSVLGLAYAGGDDYLFASAWVKRHVELGPDGAGAIYRINTAVPTDTLYFDLNSLPGLPAGTVTDRPDAAPTSGWPGGLGPNKHLFFDVDAFLKVGTAGIGDIDLSPDDKTLFVVNMGDKKMYRIPANSATVPVPIADVSSIDIPHTCTNPDDARPMALGYNNGKMYVGSVCSGQSIVELVVSPSPTLTNDITFTYSADFDNLFGETFFAEVFEYDLATNTFDANPVLKVDLTYQRGCIFREDIATDSVSDIPTVTDPSLCSDQTLNWRPWQSDWKQVFTSTLASGNTDNPNAGYPLEYPQPLLSDIEFDGEDMILGFRDLNGDRTGFAAGAPSTTEAAPGYPANQTWRGAGFGDVLRACFNGTIYVLESNGECGSVTTVGQNNPQGPGGGEFYWNDSTPGGPNSTSANFYPIDRTAGHEESSMGMLMQVAGQENVVAPAVDISEFYDGGFIWFNNATGTSDKRVKLFDAVVDFETGADLPITTTEGLLTGKANGIGDLEALCEAAPIQVGNLIWLDDNANGVQDPGEAGAAGVTVQLFAESDLTTPIATAVTDANGNYYFSSGPGTNTASSIYGLNISPETAYRIVIEQNQGGSDIDGFFPTLTDTPSSTNSDIRDSDGVSVTNGSTQNVEISFTTGVIGENDHSFDAGFVDEPIAPIYRDWGDLPETYSTTINADGPRHILVDDLYMGNCVDGEVDGAPSPQALGDDENQSPSTFGGSGTCNPATDDEDGVIFSTSAPNNSGVAICTDIDIVVQAWAVPSTGENGYMNVWADLNADGQFSSDEQVVADNVINGNLVDTTTALSFPIANSAGDVFTQPQFVTQAIIGLNIPCEQSLVGGNMGFRFRYTAGTGIGGDSPTGEAANGEVEDYILPIYGWDFGDSPECEDSSNPTCYQTSMPSSLADNYKDVGDPATLEGGARHMIIPGSVRLGTAVASEIDGEVAANGTATNEAGDGSNEEDGWDYMNEASILISRWDNGQDGFIRVNVTEVDSQLGACVYGFIDWEGDGFETGVTSTGVQFVQTDGEATITFPSTVERDDFFDGIGSLRGVYIRFRVIEGTGVGAECESKLVGTDDFALLPGNANGYACSGEVEDYFINFTPLAVTLQEFNATQNNTNTIIFGIALAALLMATALSLVGYRRRMATL